MWLWKSPAQRRSLWQGWDMSGGSHLVNWNSVRCTVQRTPCLHHLTGIIRTSHWCRQSMCTTKCDAAINIMMTNILLSTIMSLSAVIFSYYASAILVGRRHHVFQSSVCPCFRTLVCPMHLLHLKKALRHHNIGRGWPISIKLCIK